MNQPRVLVFDIETSPLLVYAWDLGKQYVTLDKLHTDRYIIAWGAKWLDDKTVMYKDNRNKKNYKDDKELVTAIWHLLDEADIVITQNGQHFDSRRLNARFMAYGMKPPSPYKHIDVYTEVKAKADFPSQTLEYTANALNKDFKKLKHSDFPGLSLWIGCMAGNIKAWNSMRKYNIHDVLSTEEKYNRTKAWLSSAAPVYIGSETCGRCGNKESHSKGWSYTQCFKTQRRICNSCGASRLGKRERI